MLTESLPISTQQNLFHSELFNQLDTKDPLIALSHTMDWEVFDVVFSSIIAMITAYPQNLLG
ncbi:hypothetical protein BSPWISOXPB_6828 [uncultured Gammaproteobacteria bacterium]|nr:hypothetical protein BSPWISOXPB_6828 [uncultured Gammaproteobacteria bacterium]